MVSSVDILTLTPGHLNITIVDNRPSPTSKRWSKFVTKKPSKYHGSTEYHKNPSMPPPARDKKQKLSGGSWY
jgi:hypothetical protein